MNKKMIFILLMILSSGFLYAQVGRIVFLEGSVDHRNNSGKISSAVLGRDILNGESLITAEDGYCEVEMDNGSLISLNPDTIFAFNEIEDREEKGKKRNIFSCIFGSADFKFKKFTGKEPYIATPSTICGVRGTDFSVLAGADGSSLYVVASGEVQVEAAGQSVALLPDEGVRVDMGKAPGRKFEVKEGAIDFSVEAEKAEKNIQENPLLYFKIYAEQLANLTKEAQEWHKQANDLNIIARQMKQNALKIKEEQGEEAWNENYRNNILPIDSDASMLLLNSRYTSLSAGSLRRYLLSQIYITVRIRYIFDSNNSEFTSFLKQYNKLLNQFEENFYNTGYLTENDI